MLQQLKNKNIFIAGTDTDVGKTYITCQLLHYMKANGRSAIGIKPLASGSELTPNGLRNDDALQLQRHASIQLPYGMINPIAFAEPIAPHIAAQKKQVELNVETLINSCQQVLDVECDYRLIEGVGGWLVPLNQQQTMADFVAELNLDVILVVGIKLGCLSHAILSYQAIKAAGVSCCGWIANCMDKAMPYQQENVETIEGAIDAPLLAVCHWGGGLQLKKVA